MLNKYVYIVMGAGILPVAINNNTMYFLLGQEVYDGCWSDFGGKRNSKTETVFKTAIREGYEELNGFLGTKTEITKLVQDNLIRKISKNDNTYHSYLFEIDYDELLPIYFNNNYKFIKQNFSEKINTSGFFEKKNIQWFTIHELLNNKIKYRQHFKEIIQKIIIK